MSPAASTWIDATSSTVTLSADESPAWTPALEITSAAASPPLPSAMISVFTSSCRPSPACAADGGAGGGAVTFAVALAGAGRSGVVIRRDHHIDLGVGGRRIDVLDRHLDFVTRDLLPALLGDVSRERAAEGLGVEVVDVLDHEHHLHRLLDQLTFGERRERRRRRRGRRRRRW